MPNYTCIKKPIISEKSSLLQDQGVNTFEVDIKANKSDNYIFLQRNSSNFIENVHFYPIYLNTYFSKYN